jgi:PTH1 family peptidyl-tRNA hydrolase
MASQHRALVGLGNPGARYQDTRHNVGFMVLDLLRKRWGWSGWKSKGNMETQSGRRNDGTVHLIKPMTYMNLSGQAVSAVRRQSPMEPADILCIVDDYALDLGRLRLRENGSAGGHNGLKSLIADLGSQQFPRLRLGVGPLPDGWDSADFVLGRFASSERPALEKMIERAADCAECWLDLGAQKAMNQFNQG